MERCPRLDTFWVEMVDLVEIDDEEESQLKEKLAGVGTSFGTGECSDSMKFGGLSCLLASGILQSRKHLVWRHTKSS